MSRATRLLLACVLALALPLKGVAAVLMLSCGTAGPGAEPRGLSAQAHSHHAAGRGQAGEAAQAHAATAWHAAAAASGEPTRAQAANAHHAHHADHTIHAQGHGGVDDERAAVSLELPGAKCSGCAPCCAAAAPAPATVGLPRIAPAAPPAAFDHARYAGIVADVPHRPPRLILA
jgi:hypothetical protein